MLKLGVVEKSGKLVVGMQRMSSLLSEHSRQLHDISPAANKHFLKTKQTKKQTKKQTSIPDNSTISLQLQINIFHEENFSHLSVTT